ncbi:MAG TPA: hypothetical protein VNB64_06100 [Solirubrobacteraceae bacterium]|nr:hypothetical protein [Solirubrobacteraceae bacterium]
MGKRQRRRGRADGAPAETDDYVDEEGNVLTLRRTVSAGTALKLREPAGGAGASAEDLWQRRTEMLFERFAVGWTIAGLPLTRQAELLGRYRMADADTRRWVRARLDEHIVRHQPELAER